MLHTLSKINTCEEKNITFGIFFCTIDDLFLHHNFVTFTDCRKKYWRPMLHTLTQFDTYEEKNIIFKIILYH
jgi:hypothetical protein